MESKESEERGKEKRVRKKEKEEKWSTKWRERTVYFEGHGDRDERLT